MAERLYPANRLDRIIKETKKGKLTPGKVYPILEGSSGELALDIVGTDKQVDEHDAREILVANGYNPDKFSGTATDIVESDGTLRRQTVHEDRSSFKSVFVLDHTLTAGIERRIRYGIRARTLEDDRLLANPQVSEVDEVLKNPVTF